MGCNGAGAPTGHPRDAGNLGHRLVIYTELACLKKHLTTFFMLNDYACIILDIFCTSVHFFNTYIKFTSNNKIFIHKDRVLILSIEDI